MRAGRAARPFHFLLRLAALLLALAAGLAAHAADALQVTAAKDRVDAWPGLRVLADPDARLDRAQALARLDEFAPPTVPKASFGQYSGAIWLWLPLDVAPGGDGLWLLDVDYPMLDHVDVALLRNGVVEQEARLGDHQPTTQRPLSTRTHAFPMRLHEGGQQALLLRVDTTSSMLVPLRLIRPEAYHAAEGRMLLVQGLLAGIGLCFALYSLSHWLSLRDRIFLDYALCVASITLFFFSYHGVGAHQLWGDNEWLTRNMPGLTVLFGLVGAFLFLERALDVASLSRAGTLVLRGGATIAGVLAAALLVGLIEYRTAQLWATVLGPFPMLVGVPAAYLRAREGHSIARYILVGWAGYGLGSLTMTGLLLGLLPAKPITMHAAQAGAVFEMSLWLMVLSVRVGQLRRKAESASVELDHLESLAQSDPLTGLPNRRGLQASLEAKLPHCSLQRQLAVYLLDLDGFKPVNDQFGHVVGDALLTEVARSLRNHTRASDVVARFGGDEFVVLVDGLQSEEDADAFGMKLLASFDRPFAVAGQLCRVGVTIGYAVAPLDGTDRDRLIRCADAALYAGKQSGRGCLRRGYVPGTLVSA
ncbi:MAG: GGDEF domain-containing protein [Limnobacter sp.]|nr:GGDEF domain-containing protein [Limnobacter sp.]